MGHHQLDAYGLFMHKMGNLIKKGYGFRFTPEDFTLISQIRNYIFNMGFEADYGMWEEGPEEHSSSFGAVLGGLMMWFDQGFYDFKYEQRIGISHSVPVSERMIADVFSALSRVLPRESASRPHDLAQLSLISPYNIVDFEMKKELLRNVEAQLVSERGVRRYPSAVYCRKGLVPGHGQTAQWPVGLAWLAICYAKFAGHGCDFDAAHRVIQFNWEERRALFDRAVYYFTRLERCMTTVGHVPEMYVGDRSGHNTPLAWAQSFHIVSAPLLLNLAHLNAQQFRLPHECGRGTPLEANRRVS